MRKTLTAFIVGGALVTASAVTATTASAQDRIGIRLSVVAPGIAVSVGQPAFLSAAVPIYGVVAPYAYEYGAPVYYRPAPIHGRMMRTFYTVRHHERLNRHQW